ncbi:Mediator of RNA polymerase II transcription subunit 33A [Vitis vinifera]|uniref:Mediator of RNA polymerase II transcription subunit 33A n=1 Tax=Vitis vinifera TaxID=29760 RepID=A0A438F675_VITVI|nr:Mediator of RNA polymerase II transcription subunit 33A [Vitis vinifera]
MSEARPPLTLDYLDVVVFKSTPCLISTPSPNTEGHLNSERDTEIQTNRETLVYSRRSKSKSNEILTSEALKESESVIVLTPWESGSNPDQVTDDLPIAVRKQPRPCTLHPISKFVSYNALSAKCRAFTTNLDRIQIPKNIQEALEISKWKEAVMEEIRALEKNETWEVMTLQRGKKPMGCKWTYDIDYTETFAPVAKLNTIRVLLSLAANLDWPLHQFDIMNAFLNGELEEEVFMTLPPGFCKEEEETRSNDGRMTILIVYVNDIILTGDNTGEVGRLKKVLATEFERKYVLDLLTETSMLGCKPSDTPIKARKRTESDGKPVDGERYQRLVGRLIYLSHTRPDIAFAISVVSQSMHSPKESHVEAVYKILRYLKGSPGRGLFFKKGDSKKGNLVTWRNKKQSVVARSNVEAEFRAVAQAHQFDGSLAELEKVFEIAVRGSDDEKISAATILCGASLIRGWNIQEHIVHFITRLLSPPVPADYSGSDSHLIAYAPMLNILLVGIASVDCVQIFSLHGLVPHLAGSLMPICEVFGSCVPNVSWTLTTGEEINAHAIFSNAFTLLLKLWRFNHPPLEHGVGDVPPVGSQLTPEYLLLVRNSHLVSSGTIHNRNKTRFSGVASSSSEQPIFLDSFPKLKVWYRQHQACIASTLSGLVHGTPVHQIVDGLLNMMFRKINRGSQSLSSVTSGSSSSSGPGSDDPLRPKLPAWDILEVVPFVVDAALTACAHGRLSPRELATGLKDLADFLPASLATIISYFSAEVTRGVWNPVFMNGTDWPSPAANLSNVEEQIRKILAATGVDVPSLAAGGNSPATLPLPLAAFASLTITYKIDRASQRFLNLAGPALEALAADCPWPCMPIVASLWTQKAKRWSDFLVFSASRTVFLHNSDAVVQLLKSCFTATLGLKTTPISSNGGVGALLGHGFGSHFCGGISPVAPGILYLRAYRSIRDVVFMAEEIVSLLMHFVREIASSQLSGERSEKLKKAKNEMKYGQISLGAALARVKLIASLAASLVWLSGGLGLVQSLIKETLPSWFISVHRSEQEEGSGGMVAMLGASKRRPKILGSHMEFLASALDGNISLGCDCATWRAYVSGFVSLMVGCTPTWVLEVDVNVLKRLSKGLRQWNEEELALALLGIGGVGTMAAAAELIIETEI